MLKIMLVLDNSTDEEFLDKVLKRLAFTVISIKKSGNFSEQLIDHFPDLVFASTLGKNEKILAALAKIKQARGKPKLVFVRQQKEEAPLNAEQKRVIDGVLHTPIDPFKLIDLLAQTTEVDIGELRQRYNQMLRSKKGESGSVHVMGAESAQGSDSVDGMSSEKSPAQPQKTTSAPLSKREALARGEHIVLGKDDNQPAEPAASDQRQEDSTYGGVLVFDAKRKSRYDEICAKLEPIDTKEQKLDVKKMKDLQKDQLDELSAESVAVKENRRHFIKTLFSTNPDDVVEKKKS